MLPSEIFTNPRSSVTVLHLTLIKQYGTEAYSWEPQTLWQEIQDDFKVQVIPINKDKIQAALTLITTDLFYQQWEVFEKICQAFNNIKPSFDYVSPLSIDQIIIGITESGLLDMLPPEGWNYEVTGYIKTALKEEGFLKAPPSLEFTAYEKDKTVPPSFEDDQRLKILRCETIRIQHLEKVNNEVKKAFGRGFL